MEIAIEKVKLKLTTEEAKVMIEDDTLDIILDAVMSLEERLKGSIEFSSAKDEVVSKIVEKVKKENRKGSDNLIERLYCNLVRNDSDLTQNG